MSNIDVQYTYTRYVCMLTKASVCPLSSGRISDSDSSFILFAARLIKSSPQRCRNFVVDLLIFQNMARKYDFSLFSMWVLRNILTYYDIEGLIYFIALFFFGKGRKYCKRICVVLERSLWVFYLASSTCIAL